MSATTMYAPPRARLGEASGEARLIRHEKAIRVIADLYVLSAAISLLLIVPMVLLASAKQADWTGGMLACGLIAVFAAIQGWMGIGLRRFDTSARSVAGLMSLLGLFGFPVGTLISIYLLHLLYGKKGKQVFSAEYRDVMERHPYEHARVSPLISVLALLFGGLALFGAAAVWLGE
jgi:hypothetical protein